jgi:hypothetical protein
MSQPSDAEEPSTFWESVQEVGNVRVSDSTTIRFEKGVTKRGGREVISIRTWISTQKYSGPTKAGFALDLKVAEEFYALLGKALGKP